jgi:hypothetical protein
MTIPRTVRATVRLAPVLTVVLCCASCSKGKPLYPVRGQVFVDGKPAEGALVVFHPVEDNPSESAVLRPSALVGEDGSFRVGSYKPKDGAPAGEYRVTVQWLPPDLSRNRHLYADGKVNPDKLGSRYANPKTSGLRAEVTEGSNELPAFQLKK